MSADTTLLEHPTAVCPVQHGRAPAASARALSPGDVLHLPLHKRMVTQYATGDSGRRELRLFYADKEISFDEPELFSFGETLAAQSRFVAGDALGWGQPGDWPRVQALLQVLIDEGVLRHADDGDLDERILGEARARPSPAPGTNCRA